MMPAVTTLLPAIKTADIENGLPHRTFTDLVEFFYRDACTRDSAVALIEAISELHGDEQTKDVAQAWAACLYNNAVTLSIQKRAKRFIEEMGIPRCARCGRAIIPDQRVWHEMIDCTAFASCVTELPVQR